MMIQTIDFHITECEAMKVYPKSLFYVGNTSLLRQRKISIVGTRHPFAYTKTMTHTLASKLTNAGACIVSGGAQGVDATAHWGAGFDKTIMVAGTGLDIRYPSINRKMIETIESQGLVLSQFEAGAPSLKWAFPQRNELIVALGEALIVAQADRKSGTMHSIHYALQMQKPIFVFPHRLGESEATNDLLRQGLATPILDIDAFVENLGFTASTCQDDFLRYCETQPLYHEAVEKFADRIFEYECLGKIKVENGRIIRV